MTLSRRRRRGTINLESRHIANYSERDAKIVEAFADELAKILHLKSSQLRRPEFTTPKIRTTHDIYLDVLTAVESGEIVATRILTQLTSRGSGARPS